MSRKYDDQMTALKKRIDGEYEALFPHSAGWERGALHLLLAHNLDLKYRLDPFSLDLTKYGLMHALRWGRDCAAKPYSSIPRTVEQGVFEKSTSAYFRGCQYVGIWFAFVSYWNGICEIHRLSSDSLEMKPNVDWMAFDALDRRLSLEKTNSEAMAELGIRARDLAHRTVQTYREIVPGSVTYSPNFRNLRELMPLVRYCLTPTYELPNEWSFKGTEIETLRTFWDAVVLLSIHHLALVSLTYPGTDAKLEWLMIWPVTDWVALISGCTGLMDAVVQELLPFHIYDRNSNTPDIALTPLLHVGGDVLVTNPYLLVSSSLERNFCAHAARNYEVEFSGASGDLAPAMAGELVIAFEEAGYRACSNVKIKSPRGKTDIDTLVWSPSERRVFAAELKWIIEPGDFMEVINRGEARCKEVMADKLPKYSAALESGAGAIVKRAFNLKQEPEIKSYSSALIIRNFAGTSRIPRDQYGFAPWKLAIKKIREGCTLQHFAHWVETMPFIPKLGPDYNAVRIEIVTPSGFRVAYHELDLQTLTTTEASGSHASHKG